MKRKRCEDVGIRSLSMELPVGTTTEELVREIDVGRDYKFYLACHGKQIDKAQVVDAIQDQDASMRFQHQQQTLVNQMLVRVAGLE